VKPGNIQFQKKKERKKKSLENAKKTPKVQFKERLFHCGSKGRAIKSNRPPPKREGYGDA